MGYNKNVFINCPFDKNYRGLIEKLIFILQFYGFNILMSVNKSSSNDRLSEIIKMINDSKYTFHDLSRHKAEKKGEIARFNMPFELGIDFGCNQYGRNRRNKIIAILDSSPHAYDIHSSDLSGRDILYHQNNSETLFKIIPDWLSTSTGKLYDSPKKLKGYFSEWDKDYRSTLKAKGYDLRTIKKVQLETYRMILTKWIPIWKKSNNYINP